MSSETFDDAPASTEPDFSLTPEVAATLATMPPQDEAPLTQAELDAALLTQAQIDDAAESLPADLEATQEHVPAERMSQLTLIQANLIALATPTNHPRATITRDEATVLVSALAAGQDLARYMRSFMNLVPIETLRANLPEAVITDLIRVVTNATDELL